MRTAVVLDSGNVVVAAHALDDNYDEEEALDFLRDGGLRPGDQLLILPGQGIAVGRELIVTLRAGELPGQLGLLDGAA